MYELIAQVYGYNESVWYLIGETSTYGMAYPVVWYRSYDAAMEAIEQLNKK